MILLTDLKSSDTLVQRINMSKEQFTDNAKRERFVRLVTIRTNSVLERLRVLGHCANKSAYFYNDQDVEKVFNEIDEQLQDVKAKFKMRTKRTFKLE